MIPYKVDRTTECYDKLIACILGLSTTPWSYGSVTIVVINESLSRPIYIGMHATTCSLSHTHT